ncbi:MAG: metal-dependent hydrolase, partial [Methylobacter sp.]
MHELKYLVGYSENVTSQVRLLISKDKLGETLLKKYPTPHTIRTDKALYAYTVDMKNALLKQSQPLSKVIYDDKIKDLHHALGLHTFISRVQGSKHKAK